MNRFDFYKEAYFKELDKKENLNSSLGTPIALITAIGVWLFYLLNNFEFNKSFFSVLLIGLMILGCIFLILGVWNLCLSYYKPKDIKHFNFEDYYDYQYKPPLQKIEEDYSNNQVEAENSLVNDLIKSTDYNNSLNLFKDNYLLKAKKRIILALFSSMFSLAVYVCSYSNGYKPKLLYQQMKVIDTVKIKNIK